MCLLFETIKIFNGTLCTIEFHNKRLNRSRSLLFGTSDYIDLRDYIKIHTAYMQGTVKCRVVYAKSICTITYAKYDKRNILTLKTINCDSIDYSYKYCDRSGIDRLFRFRGEHDDIIIVKDKRITDSSFCNLVFDDGEKLITPAMPLLAGTKRQNLLAAGIIGQDEIGLQDLKLFKSVHLINAMLDLNECKVDINNIF